MLEENSACYAEEMLGIGAEDPGAFRAPGEGKEGAAHRGFYNTVSVSSSRIMARYQERSINVVYEKNGSLTREAEKFIATVKEMFIDNIYK